MQDKLQRNNEYLSKLFPAWESYRNDPQQHVELNMRISISVSVRYQIINGSAPLIEYLWAASEQSGPPLFIHTKPVRFSSSNGCEADLT